MTSGIKKFYLLLWKNYILQKRHKVQTVVEIIVPLLFTAVLVGIRNLISSEDITVPTYFTPFDVTQPNGTYVPDGCYILYAPNTPLFKDLMETNDAIIRRSFPLSDPDRNLTYEIRGYGTEAELLDSYKNFDAVCPNATTSDKSPVLAAVIFEDLGVNQWTQVSNKQIKYSMRFPATQRYGGGDYSFQPRWYTELLFPIFQLLGPREKPDSESFVYEMHGGVPGYWGEGFLYFQQAVDSAITKAITGQDPRETYLNRFPYPPFIDDVFLVVLQSFLPLIFILSFIYSVINITKSVAVEKEKRLKESMKMMGLPNWLHWSAWFLKSFAFLLVSIILMVVLLKVKWYEGGTLAVLTYADGTLFFVFLLVYAFSIITLAFFISTLFSTANSAATASGVLFFLTYLPFTFMQPRYDTLSKGTKLITSLLNNTALSFACQIIAMWEGTGAGIQWSNLGSTSSPDDNLTLLDILIMLIFDGFLYLFLAIYIEGVWPGEYGLPMPWYFPFTKWYWLGTPRADEVSGVNSAQSRQKNPDYFEKEPQGKAGVQIQGLTKVFGDKTAVNDLNLNMYDNQITALLGHNGAGKTTTMSMLTGLFPPTGGTALVNGYDIRHDIQSVRENLGVNMNDVVCLIDSLGLCPQHDVLFDEMTVAEHLRFFCRLKGADSSTVELEVDRMLKAINLEVKKDAQAQSLSGGMKRRLSVGIAFVGGSRVVLLDEPSSGLDPGARRQIWDLIQREKKHRAIILSTHFMDEADLLADRIAIMADGQVQCCGSSLFLKKKYGGGYHLIIVKNASCKVENITGFLRHQIPEVVVDQNIGSELTYSLPDDKSHLFADMFEELEQRKEELGIDSYGASITTMEEVFMRVGKQLEEDARAKHNNQNGNGDVTLPIFRENVPRNKLYKDVDRNSGFKLLTQQLWAMIVKKCLNAVRNRALLIAQTIIPIGFLIITLISVQTLPNISSPPDLQLNLKDYKNYGEVTTTLECNSTFDQVCKAYDAFAAVDSTVRNVPDLEDFIIEQAKDDLAQVNLRYIIGLEKKEAVDAYTGFFNNQPYHTPPLALNFLSNAYLRSGGPNVSIGIANYPLPLSTEDEIANFGNAQSEGFNVGFSISFGMSFLAASFVVFLIKERETNAKHLQVVSGVRFPIFWLATFLFDAANYILPCFGLMIVLLAFQSEDFKSGNMQGYLLLVLLMYGWAVIPFMYLFSFAFTIPSSGFTRMVLFNVFTGMATILAMSILKVPELDLVNVANTLDWIFMLFPNYNLGYGISQLSVNHQYQKVCPVYLLIPVYDPVSGTAAQRCEVTPDSACCTEYPRGYLAWEPTGIGRNLLFMFLIGLVSFIVIFIMESKIIQKILFGRRSQSVSQTDEDKLIIQDSDVEAENARIRNTNLTQLYKTDNLVLRDLSKVYGTFKAVDRLCLGVQKGECFGLLGINGAGKSTTFKMLTGDIPVSSGDAFVYERSVKSEIKDVQQRLGYCPQFDALIPELTGRETIRLFARLRGVKEEEIDELADDLAAKLLFGEHIDKRCGTYSGGNKRKLSTALALVGNPPMVLLDEPTTGMDPVARRHLWDAISDVREAGTSIILTSHSMDECEALSTRLAIMVNGKFRCIGSTQHLKNKFGEGYTLIAQIETSGDQRRMTRQSLESGRRKSSQGRRVESAQEWENDLTPLRKYIEETFPGSELKDVHSGYVHYHIKNTRVTWGYMFKKMEEAKVQYKIEAYSVGQTTLEQVFLNFTRSQVNADED